MSLFSFDVAAKGAQLLKELLPAASTIAYLVNSSSPTAALYVKEAASTASALGISVHVLSAAPNGRWMTLSHRRRNWEWRASSCPPSRSLIADVTSSWRWLHDMPLPRCIRFANTRSQAGS